MCLNVKHLEMERNMIKVDKERVLQAIIRDKLLMKAEVMEKVADTIL